MRHVRQAVVALSVALLAVLVASAGAPSASAPATAGAAGYTWTGKWRATGSLAGFGFITLTQSGSSVTGTYDWSGGGSVSGKLDAAGKKFTGS